MNNDLSLNYTNVCWFCGKIYKSNRSTSKYCSKKHNSLYNMHGSQIKPLLDKHGVAHCFDWILKEMYLDAGYFMDDGWGEAFDLRCIRNDFKYTGPLPEGEELLLIQSYVIRAEVGQAWNGENIYCCKPFIELTIEEKTRSILVEGKL
jgi:hypothetical protein